MREYLDPVVKADQCAQYVDDIGIAEKNATDITRNIRAVFKCICQTGLILTIEKCHFGVRQVELLRRTISHFIRGSITTISKNSEIPKQIEIPQIQKGFAALSWVRKLVRKLYSQDG